MILKIGDIIYCKYVLSEVLTLNKGYQIINTRPKDRFNANDICINDDDGANWWFGQIGESECWTNWFVTEKEFIRNKKLTELGI